LEQLDNNPKNATSVSTLDATSKTLPSKEQDKICGKFDTVDQLQNAYNSLLKEFTKKSTQLAQMQKSTNTRPQDNPDVETQAKQCSDKSHPQDDEIIHNYLKSLFSTQAPRLISKSGFGISSNYKPPKTLAEAKQIADIILANQNN